LFDIIKFIKPCKNILAYYKDSIELLNLGSIDPTDGFSH